MFQIYLPTLSKFSIFWSSYASTKPLLDEHLPIGYFFQGNFVIKWYKKNAMML